MESLEFGTARWVLLLIGGAFVGCLVGAIFLLRIGGLVLPGLGLVGLGILFALGLVESMMARVVLGPDHLEIVSNFRSVVVPRSDLIRAVAEKGAPIALERTSGGWVKLPATLTGPHINTLRAWLSHTPAHSDSARKT